MRLRRAIGIVAAPIVVMVAVSCGGSTPASSTGPTRTSFGKCVVTGKAGEFHLSFCVYLLDAFHER